MMDGPSRRLSVDESVSSILTPFSKGEQTSLMLSSSASELEELASSALEIEPLTVKPVNSPASLIGMDDFLASTDVLEINLPSCTAVTVPWCTAGTGRALRTHTFGQSRKVMDGIGNDIFVKISIP